ncbi:unnamed protein product [Paramecium octaurelia]|uniref:Uncharacterized protein n=1 Tax=Paramecium octaurelia TaxID=43137 RepID=A0A8S1USW2_PAROT|nr:unnamed protein product [Paramecium octaurelia]
MKCLLVLVEQNKIIYTLREIADLNTQVIKISDQVVMVLVYIWNHQKK